MTFDDRCDGLYTGVSWERYTGINRTNISTLKELARSPLHYEHRRSNERQSSALSFGRSAHMAILEPERFESSYVVWDEKTASGRTRPRNGKDWDQFCLDNSGKCIVKADEFRLACNVRDAVRSKPVARKYLAHGDPEATLLWEDVETKRRCKGRLDWITSIDNVDVLVGLKTTRDHAARPFSNQAAKLLYYLQWAYYYDGYSLVTGKEPRVVEIVVESCAPHDSIVYIIPSDVLEVGREEYRRLLVRLGECERARRWPGIAENEMVFQLPAYMHDDAESGEADADPEEWGCDDV